MISTTSMKDFEVIQKLGSGSFGSVFKVRRKADKQIYALKQVKMNQLSAKEKENALNEIRILASLNNSYIVEYKECFFEENSSCLCLVMEYCNDGDIYNLIKKQQQMNRYLDEKSVWIYLIQIVKGLLVLHQMNIFHRDMKCANIFISNNVCKLGDFNISKFSKNNFAFTQAGTPYYTAPEIWRGERYTMKCDIWSIGCILYEMVTFQPPFKGVDMEGLNRSIQRGVFPPINKQKVKINSIFFNQYSSDLQNIISLCLKTQASYRPSASELLVNPIIQKYMAKYFDNQNSPSQQNQLSKEDLLKTIMLPKNLKELKNKLPKANYEVKQNKSVEKEEKKIDNKITQDSIKQVSRVQSAKNSNAQQLSQQYSKQMQQQQQQQQQQYQQPSKDYAKDYQKYYAQLVNKQNPQQQQLQQKLPPQIPKPQQGNPANLLPPTNKYQMQQQQQQQIQEKNLFQPSRQNQISANNSKKQMYLPEINYTPQYQHKALSSKNCDQKQDYLQQYRSPQVQSKSPSVRCSSASRQNQRNQSNNIQSIFNQQPPQSNYTKDYYQFLNQKNSQDGANQRRNSGHQVLKNY